MSKIAFCFPGQGSLEAGMGKEIAAAVPEAMEVFRIGSEASGLDLARLCFEAPLEELVETEVQQPALVATSLAMAEAARRHPGSMAAILGLEDEVVETLCRKILGVWPANYNCPGQIVVSGDFRTAIGVTLPNGVRLRRLGRYQLRGLPDEIEMLQVVADDLSRHFPPLRISR